jgi:hypothetical protein
VVGCGGAPHAPPASGEATAPAPSGGGIEGRLEGTWEIVRFESRDPIPNEVMPLMGEMFENLRVSVHDSTWRVEGKDSPFRVVGATGDAFQLETSGGMFDKAACRLNSKGEWEVDDRGPTWPGKTVLRRTK